MPPKAYTTTVAEASANSFSEFQTLRDEFQDVLDSMPRDRAKWSEYADQLRAVITQLETITPPPKFSELTEYLTLIELTCYDYGTSLSMRRDKAIDQLLATAVLLGERAKAFHEYSAATAEPGERPPGFAGPWTPQDYDRAATELDAIVSHLETTAKHAENIVFPWEKLT